jgi:hypothetical protein
MSVSDMADYLKDDEPIDLKLEETTETDEEDPEETTEEDDKETKEKSLEDELEEELDDKVDEDELVMPVRRKEVLAKYPQIFKEFPHLDKAVYREQKYSELLPSLADAKLAVDKAGTLDKFAEELSQGKATTILKALKEDDPEAFGSLADTYLEQLQSVDPNAYYTVLGNVVKNITVMMHRSEDADTKTAAALLYKFIFNSDKFEPPVRLSNRPATKDAKEAELDQREQEFRTTQLNTHVDTVNTRIDNTVKSIIDKNLDPKESMNDWQKQKALRDCADNLAQQIDKDTRFRSILDKLWEKAAEVNFNQESLDKIRSAYLSKAKGLLPDIIRKTRNEALKGRGNNRPNERNNPLPVGRPSTVKRETTERKSSGNSDKDKARALPKGMSSRDYLMKD